MMQFTIEPLAAPADFPPTSAATQGGAAGGPPASDLFANLMQGGLSELNTDVVAAEGAIRDLATGKSVDLHDVMISLERARLSVQTFIQVRNKLVESYQDLMRMQL
jgi:flagellar hook-basal body complex protein FliE